MPAAALALAASAASAQPPAVTAAPAAGRFIAIDRALQSQHIVLLGISAGLVRYLDAQQVERERPLTDLLALAPDDWGDSVLPTGDATPLPARPQTRVQNGPAKDSPGKSDGDSIVGVVELVDGQRFPGWPAATDPPGAGPRAAKAADSLAWSHPRFGRLVIPLDDVRTITLCTVAEAGLDTASAAAIARSARRDAAGEADPALLGDPPREIVGWGALSPSAAAPSVQPLAPASAGETEDQVTLRNGDHIRGLVEEIGATVVVSGKGAPGAPKARSETTIDRVTEIRMSNRPRPPAGIYAWLSGGTIVRLDRLESATDGPAADSLAGALSPTLGASGRGLWRIAETSAVILDAAAARPLSALPLRSQRAADGRRRFEPAAAVGDRSAPLWARDIQIRGDMTLEWELPAGASMLSGSIEMPDTAWAWGDCLITVSVVGATGDPGTILASERLNASHPRATLSAALPAPATVGQRLRVAVQEGENGPIQDWVDLKRIMVAVAAK